MNKHQKYLIEVYLDWSNDYLTYEVMSEHYGISIPCLYAMIDQGRELYYAQYELEHGREHPRGA